MSARDWADEEAGRVLRQHESTPSVSLAFLIASALRAARLAGMERAATVCETRANAWDAAYRQSFTAFDAGLISGCKGDADAIRAEIEKEKNRG